MQKTVTSTSSASIGDTTWLLVGLVALVLVLVALLLEPSLLPFWTYIGS